MSAGRLPEGARVAALADISEIIRLHELCAHELGSQRGGAVLLSEAASREPLAERLRGLIGSPSACVAVGTLSDSVVGAGIVVSRQLVSEPPLGSIELIYVEQEARSVGVGEALLGLLADWCVRAGCSGIDAAALPGIRATKNFFEMSGFAARKLVMHRPLAR